MEKHMWQYENTAEMKSIMMKNDGVITAYPKSSKLKQHLSIPHHIKGDCWTRPYVVV